MPKTINNGIIHPPTIEDHESLRRRIRHLISHVPKADYDAALSEDTDRAFYLALFRRGLIGNKTTNLTQITAGDILQISKAFKIPAYLMFLKGDTKSTQEMAGYVIPDTVEG